MSKQLKVGVVGGGIRGSLFAQVICEHPDASLAGIAEPNSQVAEGLKKQFETTIFDSAEQLVDSGAEAIIIATPDFAHLDAGLAALQANCHVLFEKPLATTVEDAKALKQAAAESTGKVMVGFENRWNHKFQAVHQILQDDPKPIIAQRVLLQDTEFVPRQMLSWSNRSTPGWFLFPHTLDMAMWLTKAHPVEVFARGVKKVLAPEGIETYDRISASFLMSDGSILDLDSGWVLPNARPAVFQFRYDIEAYGDHFEIEIDRSGITRYTSKDISYIGTANTDLRGRLIGAPVDMVRDFIDFANGQSLDVPGIDSGYQVTLAIAAAHESLTTNSNVVISY